MTDKRKHLRTPLKAKLKLFSEQHGELLLTMQDFSNGGAFVSMDGLAPPAMDSIVRVQVQGMMEDAPVIEARVVRVTSEGVGLQFIE